jgi:hypothetical protein
MNRLTWFFRPQPGFKNSIATAFYYEPESGKLIHYGHINTNLCMFEKDHIQPDSLAFYATTRFDEENDLLGPGGEYDTLQEAMDCLDYMYQHANWPDNYWRSCK